MTTLTINDYIESIEPHMDASLWGDIMVRLELIRETNNYSDQRSISVLCWLLYPYLDDDAHDAIMDDMGLIEVDNLTLNDMAAIEDGLLDYPNPHNLGSIMATPEIDLHNMLEREAREEDLQDAYEYWLESIVVPDLTLALSSFNYDKFDALVEYYDILNGEPIIYWLFGLIAEDYDRYSAFMERDRGDVDFKDMVETYTECFACPDNYLQYDKKVHQNDC